MQPQLIQQMQPDYVRELARSGEYRASTRVGRPHLLSGLKLSRRSHRKVTAAA